MGQLGLNRQWQGFLQSLAEEGYASTSDELKSHKRRWRDEVLFANSINTFEGGGEHSLDNTDTRPSEPRSGTRSMWQRPEMKVKQST